MASYEITSELTAGLGNVTAYIQDNRSVQSTNDSVTISGTVTLGYTSNGQIGTRRIANVDSVTVNINGNVFSASNMSVGGTASTENSEAKSITLGTYTKTISKTHSSQSVNVSLAVTNLTAKLVANNGQPVGAETETHTDTTAVTIDAKPSYTISYNANGGSSTPSSQTKWYNEAITLASAITRTDHLFGGWKWKNSGSPIAAGTSWNGANTTGTFYAAWEYKYQKPSFNSLTAWRTGTTASGGTYPKQDDGTNADIQVVLNAGKQKTTYGGAYSPVSTTVTFFYKLHTASSYTQVGSAQTLSTASGTLTQHISATLDIDKQYDIKVVAKVTDSVAAATELTTFISTAFFLVDMTQTGIAFGRTAENDKFICSLPTTIENNLSATGDVNISSGKKYKINGTALSASDVGIEAMTDAEYQAGTGTTARSITPARLKSAVQLWSPKLTHGNELNVYGGVQSGNFWFNYRNAETDAVNGSNVATIYCFGNYNGGVANAKIKAGSAELGGATLGGAIMTGQIKTSFKESIAMGSYQAAATTIPNLVEEVRFSSGCAGSANITTAYTANNVTIATGWYNFMYMPHRSGGVSGSTSGDNCNYGSLILSSMTSSNGQFMIRVSSGALAEVTRFMSYVEPLTKVVKFTISNISIAANTMGSVTTHTFTAQSGYTPVGIVGWNTGTGTNMGHVFLAQAHITGATTFSYRLKNTASAAASGTLAYYVLFVKDGNSGGVGY